MIRLWNVLSRWPPSGSSLRGPSSVTDADAPCDARLFEAGIPILGICYGSQLLGSALGGSVKRAQNRNTERQTSAMMSHARCLRIEQQSVCWMSHTYYVDAPPPGFVVSASTNSCEVAAFRRKKKTVRRTIPSGSWHTRFGNEILKNFLYLIAARRAAGRCRTMWEAAVEDIRHRVAADVCCSGFRAGWILRWQPYCLIRRWAIASHASLLTTGCCART